MKRIMLFAVLLFVLPTISHGQGAVSIDQVNTLVSDYVIQAGEPARFVFRLNNTTGQKCNVSNGFKISSPDGAVWDSVTIDSAGLTTSGENRFAGYFDIAFALWGGVTMGGNGSNPDTVGVLGAGNPSRASRMMPAGYNDTAIAVIVWMHDAASAGKQICIDTAFWGSGGTWVWVGSNLVDYFPTLSGLPGQPYSAGSGSERLGSGFCFTTGNEQPPESTYIRLNQWSVAEGGNDHWYAVIPKSAPWVDQRDNAANCLLIGRPAHLATILSADENDFIRYNVTNGLVSDAIANEFYLGAHRNAGMFTWITGEQWSYSNWWSGEPNGDGPAVAMWGDNMGSMAGRWNDVPDDTVGVGPIHQLWAIIEWDDTIVPPQDSLIRLTQWPASQGGNEHWYAVIAKSRPWKDQKQIAESLTRDGVPGYLATINSPSENSFIMNSVINGLETDAIADEFYLGAHRESGVFGWITDEPWNFTHWLAGEPSGDGAAVTIWGTPTGSMAGYWNDVPDDTVGVGSIHQLWAIVEWGDTGVTPPGVDTIHVPDNFTTIQEAINFAQNGSTILIAPGTYAGELNFLGKAITLKSTLGPRVTRIVPPAIAGSSSIPSALVTFNNGETSSSVLEGFTLEGGWIGVLCLGSGPTIRQNLLKDQQVDNWAAISLAGNFPVTSAVEGPAPAIIENNTIVNCVNGGISTFSTVAPTIRNNIIASNGHYGIHRQDLSLPLYISYNDIYGNPEATQNVPDQGTGAIQLDPLFAPDFTLLPNSPCINAGDPNPIFNDPDGTRNDMGAIPFGGSGPSGLMNLVQWRAADGGNDHWYAVIPEKFYWIEADAKAKTFAKDGIPGHLATIASPQENQFIVNHVLIGANQGNSFDNFFIGGRDTGGNWQWITGEPWGYTNWASGEPNNNGIETALCMYGHYDTYSHAIPGTWNNSLPDGTVNQLHQYWSVVEFGVGDTVVVDDPIPTNEWISLFCAAPYLDGEPLLPGAVIRAFDPQGVLCGKASVKADGSLGFMLVYRDDNYTDVDEGAEPGDKISLRIGSEPVTVTPEVHWTQNGDQFRTCVFDRNACITLHLNQGWNLISWNVGWTGAPRDLLAPIMNCVEFVLGFDNGGLVYDPQLERFSTLSNVDHLHGYWVKMACDAELEVCGESLNNMPAIQVDRGWNLVSYLPWYDLDPFTGFYTLGDYLQVAIGYDNGPKVFVPSNPTFSTLTTLEPGFGYWLRLSSAGTLIYGLVPEDEDDTHQPLIQSGGDTEPLGSRVWMSLYGEEITVDGIPLASNSSIEVHSPAGELVGRGLYTDKLLKFTPVYGSDGDEGSARFAKLNDQLTLKVNGQEVSERILWTGEGSSYRIGALTTSSLPSTYALEQNYPNPFNPATTIAFAVPKHQRVRIVVFNLLGQEIRTLADDEYDAGQYEVVWDGRDRGGDMVPTGLYFYRMESGDVNLTRKMMLLK